MEVCDLGSVDDDSCLVGGISNLTPAVNMDTGCANLIDEKAKSSAPHQRSGCFFVSSSLRMMEAAMKSEALSLTKLLFPVSILLLMGLLLVMRRPCCPPPASPNHYKTQIRRVKDGERL